MKKSKKVNTKAQIHSTLNDISDEVWAAKDADTCRQIICDHIEKSGINQSDKDVITNTVRTKKSLTAVWQYFANSLMKYEGLGVINANK